MHQHAHIHTCSHANTYTVHTYTVICYSDMENRCIVSHHPESNPIDGTMPAPTMPAPRLLHNWPWHHQKTEGSGVGPTLLHKTMSSVSSDMYLLLCINAASVLLHSASAPSKRKLSYISKHPKLYIQTVIQTV